MRRVDGVSSGPLSASLPGYQLLKILFLQRSRIQIGTVYYLFLKQMLRLVPLIERTKSTIMYLRRGCKTSYFSIENTLRPMISRRKISDCSYPTLNYAFNLFTNFRSPHHRYRHNINNSLMLLPTWIFRESLLQEDSRKSKIF